MNCQERLPDIALFVEGDLTTEAARDLVSHLTVCDRCAEAVEQFRVTQSSFKELRNEGTETAALSRVHARVMAEVLTLESRRSAFDRIAVWLWGWRWSYAVLGTVVAAVSLAAWMLPTDVDTPTVAFVPPPPTATVLESTTGESVAASPVTVEKESPPPVRRRKTPVPVAPEPAVQEAVVSDLPQKADSSDTLVQILTDDPNVIIYWLINQNGGS